MKLKCIYIIKSKIKPDRFYIGSSRDFKSRQWKHMASLKNNKHHSKKLQNHVNKYGKEDIYFEILEYILDDNLIDQREQYYVNIMNPFFNTCLQDVKCTRGIKMTQEQKKKWYGNKNASGKRSKQFKEFMKDIMIGKSHASGKRSTEIREKFRMRQIGKIVRKVSVIDTNTGKIYPMVKDAAMAAGSSYNHFIKQLKGERKNNTGFKYA